MIIGDRAERAWMDLDLVGQQSGALVAFVPPVSIKDRSLHWIPQSGHRPICPEHILAYGSGKTCFSLVMGSSSFGTDFLGGYIYGLRRSKHHTEVGPAVLGA
jgi:hypothetical protein